MRQAEQRQEWIGEDAKAWAQKPGWRPASGNARKGNTPAFCAGFAAVGVRNGRFCPGSARFRVLSQEKPAKMLNFSKFGLEKPDGTPTSDPSLYSVQS
ncbi:hypothetical protein N5I84_01135 [Ralstonia sp. CHL-2022]|uniref:hypothetical protein n=1 Tax=Ralstonia mojiangensis TaxID=2953895 RepID=UPI0021B4613B|nr:hypothetical protein [Ralstonia mojiangensis]MCT7294758.1 hypothetical protein [Ralstonia mojiangensis]